MLILGMREWLVSRCIIWTYISRLSWCYPCTRDTRTHEYLCFR